MNRLDPSRRTRQSHPSLFDRFSYEIRATREGVRVVPLDVPRDPQRTAARAVINPALFKERGKTLRITFVGVQSYGQLDETSMQRMGFECYAVLGQADLMVTHLHTHAHDLLFDIKYTIPVSDPRSVDDSAADRFPFFQVKRFHKVLGIEVTDKHMRAFAEQSPAPRDVTNILAIGEDWADESVSDEERARYQEAGWILGVTPRQPGEINAVMTIYVNHPGEGAEPLRRFQDAILPMLKRNTAITSIFEGVGHLLWIHYLLRITCPVDQLFDLIQEVHDLAIQARLIVSSETSVIVKKWSSLDISKCLLTEDLSQGDAQFRASHVLRRLTGTWRQQFLEMTVEQQVDIICAARTLRTSLAPLASREWLHSKLDDIEQQIIQGLVRDDISVLANPHNVVQGRVEQVLRAICTATMSVEVLAEVRQAVGIASRKDSARLTYGEWLRIAAEGITRGVLDVAMAGLLEGLYESTPDVRNAIKHDEWDRLTLSAYIDAMQAYCSFLEVWDAQADDANCTE